MAESLGGADISEGNTVLTTDLWDPLMWQYPFTPASIFTWILHSEVQPGLWEVNCWNPSDEFVMSKLFLHGMTLMSLSGQIGDQYF